MLAMLMLFLSTTAKLLMTNRALIVSRGRGYEQLRPLQTKKKEEAHLRRILLALAMTLVTAAMTAAYALPGLARIYPPEEPSPEECVDDIIVVDDVEYYPLCEIEEHSAAAAASD